MSEVNSIVQYKLTKPSQRQLYYIYAHITALTDLAPLVAEANAGGPGTIKMDEI